MGGELVAGQLIQHPEHTFDALNPFFVYGRVGDQSAEDAEVAFHLPTPRQPLPGHQQILQKSLFLHLAQHAAQTQLHLLHQVAQNAHSHRHHVVVAPSNCQFSYRFTQCHHAALEDPGCAQRQSGKQFQYFECVDVKFVLVVGKLDITSEHNQHFFLQFLILIELRHFDILLRAHQEQLSHSAPLFRHSAPLFLAFLKEQFEQFAEKICVLDLFFVLVRPATQTFECVQEGSSPGGLQPSRHDVEAELGHYFVCVAQRWVFTSFRNEGADRGEGVAGTGEMGQFLVDHLMDLAVLEKFQLLIRPPLPQQLRIQRQLIQVDAAHQFLCIYLHPSHTHPLVTKSQIRPLCSRRQHLVEFFRWLTKFSRNALYYLGKHIAVDHFEVTLSLGVVVPNLQKKLEQDGVVLFGGEGRQVISNEFEIDRIRVVQVQFYFLYNFLLGQLLLQQLNDLGGAFELALTVGTLLSHRVALYLSE